MAVVSDLIEVARNLMAKAAGARPTRRHRALSPKPLLPMADIRSRYYLRFSVADKPGVLGQITTILGQHEVSIEQVIQDAERDPGHDSGATVFVVTHQAREGDVQAALAKIGALPICQAPGAAPPRLIRIAE
jgi:homoserine dehydrogenase